jgi:PBP superfamily domain
VAFAKDAITWAARSAVRGGTDALASLTTNQLKAIFTRVDTNWAEVGGKSAPIKVFLPQAGSGTLSTWEKFMGITTLGACVSQAPEENEGTNKVRSKPVLFSQLPNQLLLVTADSKLAPAHYIEVEAKFIGAVVAGTAQSSAFPESGYLPQVSAAEAVLGRDSYALLPAMAWAIALAAVALLGSYLAVRWARWPAWIVTIPVLVAIIWNLYQALPALLPNLY